MKNPTDVLNSLELDALVKFFTHHMSQETRGQIMANYPQIYVKLYGSAPSLVESVLREVKEGLS